MGARWYNEGMVTNAVLLDERFRALADPSRRHIVERLCSGPASVSELAQPLPMSLAAVVQHLQVLEASGLVTSTKKGRVRTCTLRTEALRDVQRWLDERQRVWERRLDRLNAVLAEQQLKEGDHHEQD